MVINLLLLSTIICFLAFIKYNMASVLQVIARQEDKPPTSAHVTIQVLDDNDNSPEFVFKAKNDKQYYGIVQENAPPERQVQRVRFCY